MATYVNDLRLKEIATGDESGTWGTSTNTNLELIGEALGYSTEGITTNADTHTTTVADGATDPGRAMYIKYTGALDSDCTITIAPNTMSRVHFIENATTDSGSSGPYNIIISQGSGANVTIPNGFVKAVYLDGAGSGAAVTEAFTDLSVGGNLLIDGTTPKLTIGDGGAEDTAIVFDGNAQDFYIGLDDSADDLIIGLGSTVGTTPIISVDENKDVAIPDGGLTITVSDNTDNLSLVSTDTDDNPGPNIRLYRNSANPAVNDLLGKIDFEGRNDNSEDILYASISGKIMDETDGTEDANLRFWTIANGTETETLTLSSGKVGIGTTSPATLLDVKGSEGTSVITLNSATAIDSHPLIGELRFFSNDNSTNSSGEVGSIEVIGVGTWNGAANSAAMTFNLIQGLAGTTSPVEAFRIDGAGKILIGNTTQRNLSGITSVLSIEGTGYNSSSLTLVANSADSNGAYLMIGKSRGSSVGSSTALQNGDQIGGVYFNAADGTDMNHAAAYISARIYGDVSGNDIPGLLQFATTPDGSNTPTEKLAILPSGGITFNGDRSTANALDDYEEGSFTINTDGGDFSGGSSNHTAYYTKIGQLVNWFWYSQQSTISNVSGNATLTGLPFTSKSTGYTLFQFLHGTGVDGNSTGGYVNVSNTNAVFVDAQAVSIASYIAGSSKYVMVAGTLVTDS